MVVGHVAPEAYVGGPIALVKEGDSITIDAKKRLIQLNVPAKSRRAAQEVESAEAGLQAGACQVHGFVDRPARCDHGRLERGLRAASGIDLGRRAAQHRQTAARAKAADDVAVGHRGSDGIGHFRESEERFTQLARPFLVLERFAVLERQVREQRSTGSSSRSQWLQPLRGLRLSARGGSSKRHAPSRDKCGAGTGRAR